METPLPPPQLSATLLQFPKNSTIFAATVRAARAYSLRIKTKAMTKSFRHISNRSGAILSRRRENDRPARTAQKTYNVVLVSVNGAKLPDTNRLQEYLNSVYHQANVEFSVSTDRLDVENLFPFSHGDKNRFSGYNDDQKRVLEAYDSRIEECFYCLYL